MTFFINKISILSGKLNTMNLPLEPHEYVECHALWDAGMTIQKAFPMLNETQREFLITGLSEEEQQIIFTETEDN